MVTTGSPICQQKRSDMKLEVINWASDRHLVFHIRVLQCLSQFLRLTVSAMQWGDFFAVLASWYHSVIVMNGWCSLWGPQASYGFLRKLLPSSVPFFFFFFNLSDIWCLFLGAGKHLVCHKCLFLWIQNMVIAIELGYYVRRYYSR